MQLTETYPGAVNVRRIRFAICPEDIVAFRSYADNDLEHTISVALGFVLRRGFTDRRGQR